MTDISDIEDFTSKMFLLFEGYMSGADTTRVKSVAAKRLIMAACFGAAAYEKCDDADQAPGTMMRAFLLAAHFPESPELDYLRSNHNQKMEKL